VSGVDGSLQSESMGLRCGKYLLGERLAVGGMAEIFSATASGEYGFARRVVVKRLLPHLAARIGVVELFLDEARLLARLHHPRVVQVLDLGTADGAVYQALEHLDGVDLAGLLQRGALPADVGLRIGLAVAEGLAHVHGARDEEGNPLGIVHGDLAPGNVMVTRAGEVKLIDFGVARWQGRASGPRGGTRGFIAPEVEGGAPTDIRSDLYGLGQLLERLFAGAQVPVLARALVESLCADDPTQRPRSAEEVGAVLNTCLRELGPQRPLAQSLRPLMPEKRKVQRAPRATTRLLTAPVRAVEAAVVVAAHVVQVPAQWVAYARRWALPRIAVAVLLTGMLLGLGGFASGVWVGFRAPAQMLRTAMASYLVHPAPLVTLPAPPSTTPPPRKPPRASRKPAQRSP
jgi:hypothetical protein